MRERRRRCLCFGSLYRIVSFRMVCFGFFPVEIRRFYLFIVLYIDTRVVCAYVYV